MCVHVFVWVLVYYSFSVYTRFRIEESYGNTMGNILRNFQTVFQRSCSPTSNVWARVPIYPYPCQDLSIFFDYIHPTGYEVVFAFWFSFSLVWSLSHVWLFVTPWTAARQASLSIIKSWSLLKLMSVELVMPSSHLIHCRPLFLLPSIFPSIRQPKYWSFSFSISCSSDQGWFPLGWTGWISLQCRGLSRVFSNTTVQKHQFFST